MDVRQRVSNDKESPPPSPPDSNSSPPTDSPPPPSKDSPPSPSPPDSSSSPPTPSPPTPSTKDSSSPPTPSPPSPSPPSPSPPTPSSSQTKDISPPPPTPSSPSDSSPPPSPPSSKDSPPQKESPPPSPPTDGSSSSPPGSPPATPATPPPSTETPPSANPSPPGQALPPPTTTAPPHEGAEVTPPAPLGELAPPISSEPTAADTTLPPPPSTSNGNQQQIVIIGVIGAAVVVLAFAIICVVCSRKKKRKQHDQYYNRAASQYNQRNMDHVVKFPSQTMPMQTGTPRSPPGGAAGGWATSSDGSNFSGQHMPNQSPLRNLGGYSSQSQFTYQELATATSGFSQENLLGQGGFGFVHKGVLPNGKVVAVKSLKSGSGQGEREFQAEVEIISRVHHRHLVSLVGYCIAQSQRMLVYEFVPNQTLEHHLHGKGVPVMDWASRMRIALGSAKGLAYLHEDCHPRIIHRDIKAANILLDENYEAMVADFGLAKLSSDNFTHVSTRVMGTFGYLAPEYASSGKLSDKSDVFSFGVMLLELVTGQRPVDPTGQMEDSLVDWARPLMTKALEDGNYDEIADPRMEGNFVPYEMAHMIACASASVRHSAKRRPRMSQIVRSLEGDLAIEDMNIGVKNAVSTTTSGMSSSTSNQDSIYDTVAYNADMLKFRKMVLNPQETPASTDEFGATNEYALDPTSPVSEPKK